MPVPLGSSHIRARIARLPLLGRPLSAALTVPNPYYHPRQSPARLAYSNVVSECQRLGLPPRMLHIGSQSARKTGFIHLDIAQHGSAEPDRSGRARRRGPFPRTSGSPRG